MQALNIDQAIDLAIAHQTAGRLGEAQSLYRQVLTLRPDLVSAHNNLGNVFAAMGQADQAIASYRQALFLQPDFFEASYNLAKTYHEFGRLEEAVDAYRLVVQLQPEMAEAQNNLGITLCSLARFEEGIAAFRQAVALRPDQPQTWNNLGNALGGVGRFDEAATAYCKAISLRPNYPTAHLNLGINLLTRGDFVRGWPEYEWRWRVNDPRPRLHLTAPWWDGNQLHGRTILLHNEQGFGDTIQFVRYVPIVADRGGKVILVCQEELIPLLHGLKGVIALAKAGGPIPKHDLHCPLLSLPGLTGTTPSTIPGSAPYLSADVKLADQWKERLPAADGRLKVGLAWAGEANHPNDRNRSLRLEQLLGLWQVPNTWFCSLQTGEASKQARAIPQPLEIKNWSDELKDFGDTAALIANLDVVVSVDTAVAHLAGAIGKPVFLLVPFIPDWRWMLARGDSPWYPTMRLFRQPRKEDWDSPIREIIEAVSGLSKKNRDCGV
jgi:Flp pilus assembly protein TadD